jgi:GT2 family glycosyltransferase
MSLSLVIPTYRREAVLVETLRRFLALAPPPDEIVVVDQTPAHEPATAEALAALEREGRIRLIRLPEPSIPKAMNTGLLEARHDIVLFADDDVVPDARLVGAHLAAQVEEGVGIVAGRVIQPWDKGVPPEKRNPAISGFSHGPKRQVREFMGGNFSIRRCFALGIGGFDENFVRAAYRFEKEFAERVLGAGGGIVFEPPASLEHLQAREGGTRAFGDFRRTFRPGHAVGEYYFLLRSRFEAHRVLRILGHPWRAVRTRYHLRRPWWIPATLLAEASALVWAVALALHGPRLIDAGRGPGRC